MDAAASARLVEPFVVDRLGLTPALSRRVCRDRDTALAVR